MPKKKKEDPKKPAPDLSRQKIRIINKCNSCEYYEYINKRSNMFSCSPDLVHLCIKKDRVLHRNDEYYQPIPIPEWCPLMSWPHCKEDDE